VTLSGAWRRLSSGGPTWHKRKRAARLAWAVGKGVERRVERGAEGRRAAGRRSGPGAGGGVQQRRSRGGREGGRRRGLKCNFRETQGLHCKALIIFKLVLKWRWSQKQKWMVFRALQLCFRVYLQKSNSFEVKTKLIKVFKIYVNPIEKLLYNYILGVVLHIFTI
jgi:hypothetical protein